MENDEKIERMRHALEQIKIWAEAYSEEACEKPDYARADKILAEHGISMSAMHWYWGNHIVKGVWRYAKEGFRDGAE